MDLDPRGVANLILDEADNRGRKITNLALQKILYFVHGRFLVEEETPLLAGSFEAWQYGPVSISVYDSFKKFGSSPINTRAKQRDIFTRQEEIVYPSVDAGVKQKILDYAAPFFDLSPGRLVELSHAKNSPWELITRGPNGERTFGLRITNRSIKENFRHHKVSIENSPRSGEPHEESSPY